MIQEERIWFTSNDLQLEGLFHQGEIPAAGVVLAHPNPAMGGTMHSFVVECLMQAFAEMGFSTLRFNFRGAGHSEGISDEGRGEVNDLREAVSFLREKGAGNIILAGYSFGAWVVSRYLLHDDADFDKVIMVAPPVSIYSFAAEALANRVSLIICGDRDSFCLFDDVSSFGDAVRAQIVRMPRTDHFFAGREDSLIQAIQEYMRGK
ncbi:MAG: alpha/beta fold hydrolase [Syntrophobacterales bacterium]|jgi:alpha/beta superfamily hydrolase|nr:alpha/beta fold hydrolase [Syntrophobacterales bacterium]